MDSITQATLGAAVGHAVLGKKMGNKAILVGAIAGTIPDLDVLSRLFLEHEIYGLVYHRGISHSILFTVLAAPLLGWLSLKYYETGWNKNLYVQKSLAFWWGLLYFLLFTGFCFASYYSQSLTIIFLTMPIAWGAIYLFKSLRSSIKNHKKVTYKISFKSWTFMYFMAFLTHWLIDACTAYGTQIFEPFSNYRVAFNNISIVDPLYTLPMFLCLIIVLFVKTTKRKMLWNYLGITVSTLYMASTFYNKSIVNNIIEQNLKDQAIEYEEFITSPTIFNTILWQTTVRAKDAYYYSTYSLFDTSPKVNFIKLPKNHDLIEKYNGEKLLDILIWFANGYYNISEYENGVLMFNNLRFGMFDLPKGESLPIKDRYIFRFKIFEKDGVFQVEENRGTQNLSLSKMMKKHWLRIWGKQ